MMKMNEENRNNIEHSPSRSLKVRLDPRVFDRNMAVSVRGPDGVVKVKDIKDFNEAGFQPLLLKNLVEAGYNVPTTVQRYVIPIIKAGRDLIVGAETGTGKTAAFLLPIINKLISNIRDTGVVHPASPQVLVITSTIMEALQIYNETKKFIKGSPIIARWWLMENNDCHILIVTPRMLMDQDKKHTLISFMRLHFLVLYEADSVMDLIEYGGDLKYWIKESLSNSKERQTLMFSTAFSDHNQLLAQLDYLTDYLFLAVSLLNIEDSDLSIAEMRRGRARRVIPDDNTFSTIKYVNWFDKSGLKPSLIRDLALAGYAIPTVVQRQAIPIILSGRDLLACAATGTGKTAAYLIPITHTLICSNRYTGVPFSSVTLSIRRGGLHGGHARAC